MIRHSSVSTGALLLLSGLLIPVAALPQATPKFGKELERLQEARDEAVARAVEPIDRKFKEQLQALLAKATAAGDLDTAVLIKKKIEVIEAQDRGVVLDGTTWKRDGSKIQFLNNGEFLEEWAGGPSKSKWERISTSEIQVTHRSGSKNIFILSKKADTITRKEDGLVWSLEKKN